MRIYLAHRKDGNYQEELYQPLREDSFFNKHELLLPHEDSSKISNTRDFYKTLDIFIAECSEHATGMGIELGWAYDDKVPIYCIHKKDKRVGNSIRSITSNIYEYKDSKDMVRLIKEIVKKEEYNN